MMMMASSSEPSSRTTPSPADFSRTRRNDDDHVHDNDAFQCVISDSDVTRTTNETATKIELNFSVDRLLSADSCSPDRIRVNRNNNSSSPDPEYDCCRYTNNNRLQPFHASQHHHHLQQHGSMADEETMLAANDPKSVVRPMPIRVLGNSPRGSVMTPQLHPQFGMLSQTVLKYHQQHQHHQQPPTHQSSLANLMGPLNSLKSLQINQHLRQTSLQQQQHHKPHHDMSGQLAGVAVNSNNVGASGKRKRSWSRAVFSNLQRKGLEIQFQQQKYITKPDRRKLAARLNLTDAQVKVWFQNRRMKWRHTRENLKSGQEKPSALPVSAIPADKRMGHEQSRFTDVSDKASGSSCSDTDGDEEIDVVE